MRKYDISRYGLDTELRSYGYIRLRYRKVEYEREKRERSDESYDEEKYVGISSDLLVLVDLCFFAREKYRSREKFTDLISSIFEKCEIVVEYVVFGVFFLEFYIVVLLEEPDPEGFSELLELAIIGYERESLHREAIDEELKIEIITEGCIVIRSYLYLLRLDLGNLLKYLYESIVFMDGQSFFIHIGRLCSEVYGR